MGLLRNCAEEWRPVVDFPAYEISSCGRMKSFCNHPEGKLLKLVNPHGVKPYLKVTLYRNGIQHSNCEVHRMVAEAFIGPCPEGYQVRHFVDKDATNNHVWNLKYGTPLENARDKELHGTAPVGSKNGNARLTDDEVIEIWEMLNRGIAQVEIAKKYGVGSPCISKIKNGLSWSHIQSKEVA